MLKLLQEKWPHHGGPTAEDTVAIVVSGAGGGSLNMDAGVFLCFLSPPPRVSNNLTNNCLDQGTQSNGVKPYITRMFLLLAASLPFKVKNHVTNMLFGLHQCGACRL
jgi:hypothetical protein